jgi:hypothetical protein
MRLTSPRGSAMKSSRSGERLPSASSIAMSARTCSGDVARTRSSSSSKTASGSVGGGVRKSGM